LPQIGDRGLEVLAREEGKLGGERGEELERGGLHVLLSATSG
jgi:hypothetical protein